MKGYKRYDKNIICLSRQYLESPEKACKTNDFTAGYGTYYTTITPFFERVLK